MPCKLMFNNIKFIKGLLRKGSERIGTGRILKDQDVLMMSAYYISHLHLYILVV